MTKLTKILLVDDEQLVRDELGEMLEDEGYDVVTAADGVEGMNRFREEAPDMVITDVRMPHRDGISLAMLIRSEAPSVPVTVVTGHGNFQMTVDALRSGVTDFIRKPARFEYVHAALCRMETALTIARRPRDPHAADTRTEKTWAYQLGDDLQSVSAFVDNLLSTGFSDLDRQVFTELTLGLRELVLNAVEHGILGISYEEKSNALEQGRFEELICERRNLGECRARRATVLVRREPGRIVVEISDDGRGFDWRTLPDPNEAENLMAEHGRGILLATLLFNELRFNETGNRVTAVKILK